MKKKICCIFNLAPHYRAPIYKLMDEELHCDFYFGDKVESPIKIMNVNELNGYKETLPRISITKWNYYWLSGCLKPIFGSYKYYIISGGTKYLSHWLLLIISKISNKQVITWSHGMKGNKSGIGKSLEKTFYNLCDIILLYGTQSQQLMIEEGIKKQKLVPIYNSLDYDLQKKLRESVKKSDIYKQYFGHDYPIIIHIGRIQKYKRLDLLLEILVKLKSEGKKCNLVFVGEDIENNNLADLAKGLGVSDQIWFYGPCYEEEKIAELLFNANVCVSPGPIGLTALHAATYGIPIVTNDNFQNHGPEFEIIKEGINGSFFRSGDETDLYLKVKQWIYLDINGAIKCRIYSQKLIDEKYNPHCQIKILKQIINS